MIIAKQAYDDLTGRISNPSVLEAFNFLVGELSKSDRFEIRPNVKGQKKSVHFSSGKVSYYALIANKQWLLWYFRRPGFVDHVFDWDMLKDAFPNLERSKRSDPALAEGVLRIKSISDAEAVVKFVIATKHS